LNTKLGSSLRSIIGQLSRLRATTILYGTMEAARPAVKNWSRMEEVVSLLLLTIKQLASLPVRVPLGPEPF